MEPFELPHQHEDASHLHELEEYLRRTEYFQTVALVFRQLSDANRVRLFWLLCHCEECVVNLAAMMGMSPPALSHHLRQLRESGLIVSRRDGKEVYYKAAESEQAQLLHRMIERTVEIACPEEGEDVASAPHLPPLDAHALEGAHGCSAEQLETIRHVHEALTADLSSRITIDELSRRFLMNPSTMKEVFKTVYGQSIAAHIREHRMERAAELLHETDASMAEIAAAIGYESASKFSAEFRKAYGAPHARKKDRGLQSAESMLSWKQKPTKRREEKWVLSFWARSLWTSRAIPRTFTFPAGATPAGWSRCTAA